MSLQYEQEVTEKRRDPTRIYGYLIEKVHMYVGLLLQQKGIVGVTINI